MSCVQIKPKFLYCFYILLLLKYIKADENNATQGNDIQLDFNYEIDYIWYIIVAVAVAVAVFISIIIIIIIFIIIRKKIQRRIDELEREENDFVMMIIKSTSHLSPIPEESTGEEICFFNKHFPSRILSPNELDNFLRNYDKEEDPLEEEHSSIPKFRNIPKYNGDEERDRYANVKVYEFNRVQLSGMNGYLQSDYINASKISGFSIGIKYIATQGPLTQTVDHFWKMVWQERVLIIIMLTHLEEDSMNKCDIYWPEKHVMNCDGISIYADTVRRTTIFTERVFKIKNKKESRKITHLHFHSWFDNSIPKVPQDFVEFLKYFRNIITDQVYTDNPVIVHCSAGLGRTGTFILCDYIIDMAEREKIVNFPKALFKLRSERAFMLKDFKQYMFSHCVVNEFLNGKESSYFKYNFLTNYNNIVKNAGQDLATVASSMYWCSLLYDKKAHQFFYDNIHKHRIAKPILSCESFFYLKYYPMSDNTSSYINAIRIEKFLNTNNQFICTQQPLTNTIGDFWRLVDLENINLIISMHDIEDNNLITPKFWPSSLNKTIKPVDYITVKNVDCTEKAGYYIVSLKMKNLDKNVTNVISLIQFTCWKKDVLPEVNLFVSFLVDYLKHFKKRKSVFACYDGAGGCGIFLTLLGVLEKLKKDDVFDIVSVVRYLRKLRDDFMDDSNFYKFVYEVTKRALSLHSSLILKKDNQKAVYENFNLKDNNYSNLPIAGSSR